MIEFLSTFAKKLGLSIVIVSILEMILPNNKTKKYIRIIMGIFIIFNILEPFINNTNIFDIDNINLDDYYTNETSSIVQSKDIDQSSMNNRIKELYIQELKSDIESKLIEKGYKVVTCKIDVKIGDKNEETKISKIDLRVEKNEEKKEENKQESLENKIVTEVQKIKTIEISVNKNESENGNSDNEKKINKTDIQNIKKFLIDEYGVNEECLEIN